MSSDTPPQLKVKDSKHPVSDLKVVFCVKLTVSGQFVFAQVFNLNLRFEVKCQFFDLYVLVCLDKQTLYEL